jgi:hypothetical protein
LLSTAIAGRTKKGSVFKPFHQPNGGLWADGIDLSGVDEPLKQMTAGTRLRGFPIGKPETYMMMSVSGAERMMSGSARDAAFVEVRSIGGLSRRDIPFLLKPDRANKTFHRKVFTEQFFDLPMFLPIIELKFGVSEYFVECLVHCTGIVGHNQCRNAACFDHINGFFIRHFVVGAGEDDATKMIFIQRAAELNDPLQAAM